MNIDQTDRQGPETPNENNDLVEGEERYPRIEDDQSDNDPNAIYFGDSKLQTQQEFDNDKVEGEISNARDSVSAAGDVDDLQSNSDGAAGTDMAGTAERKTYGDTELNKGLESQAKGQED